MEKLTAMVVGGGGREHAIARAYERSDQVKKVVMVPGNDYVAYTAEKEVVLEPASAGDPDSILAAARKHRPDVIDVNQDEALAAGTVDLLQEEFTVFGPSQKASQIEWDKGWSRDFMSRHGIRHPEYQIFGSQEAGKLYLRDTFARARQLNRPAPDVYIKAAGLCAGKGALRAQTPQEADDAVDRMAAFGPAGDSFVIEDRVSGEEFSYYAVSDGFAYRTFTSAKDHKRSHDGDTGEQTGGMGVVVPAPAAAGYEPAIDSGFIEPALRGLADEGRPFKGIIYFGGIRSESGISTIEYNARWGDPEAQAILPGLRTDYSEVTRRAAQGDLGDLEIEDDGRARVCVVGASRGYPGDYTAVRGLEIRGLAAACEVPDVDVFGAAIAVRDGRFYADGGRLLNVVGSGRTVSEARQRAYEAIEKITIGQNGLHYRRDIAGVVQ